MNCTNSTIIDRPPFFFALCNIEPKSPCHHAASRSYRTFLRAATLPGPRSLTAHDGAGLERTPAKVRGETSDEHVANQLISASET